ncbi:tetratricopeptide repeat protein, partial [bacterium]|nr:tetratricopeptide repeat protein [bacterium]
MRITTARYLRVLVGIALFANVCTADSLEIDSLSNPEYLLQEAERNLDVEPTSAERYAAKALGLSECTRDPSLLMRARLILGSVAYRENRSADALDHFTTILQTLEELPSSFDHEQKYRLQIQTLSKIGHVYNFIFADYEGALNYYLRAMEIAQKRDLQDLTASALVGCGFVYRHREEYDESQQFFEQAAETARRTGDTANLISAVNEMGNIAWFTGNPEESLRLHMEALRLSEASDDKYSMGFVLHDIGFIYNQLEQYDSALVYYQRDLEVMKERNVTHGIAITMSNIAGIHMIRGQSDRALELQLEALEIARESGARRAVEHCYYNLAQIYDERNDPARAFTYLRHYTELHDSLFNEAQNDRISDMRVKYATERVEGELRWMRDRNTLMRSMMAGGGALVVLLGVVVYGRFRGRVRAQKEMERTNRNLQLLNKRLEVEISIREKSEQELRESRQRFRDVALSSADWIWEMDNEGRYTFTAGRFQEITGYTRLELLRKRLCDLIPDQNREES